MCVWGGGGRGGGGGGGVTLSDQLVVNTAIISVKTGADRLWSPVRGSSCLLSLKGLGSCNGVPMSFVIFKICFFKRIMPSKCNIENNFPSAV